MIFQRALLGGLVLAGHVAAKVNDLNIVFQRSDDVEDMLRKDASLLATLTKRQDSNPADTAPRISTTPASGDPAQVDLAKWEEQTRAACSQALTSLNGRASNPSGIAVCYNLPFLNNETGVFQAELRMYNISVPIDPWTGVVASNVMITLSYAAASVVAMNQTVFRRDVTWPSIKAEVQDGVLVTRQNNGAPQELKVLNFVGRINPRVRGTDQTVENLQPLLRPQIELIATNPNGQEVKTLLSSQEASFVNGVFAAQATSTNNPQSSAAVAAATKFHLPGTNLAFFPIGLVITCVWTAFFLLTVGLGTVGRIQFREQYRRRVKREMANTVRTI